MRRFREALRTFRTTQTNKVLANPDPASGLLTKLTVVGKKAKKKK